MTIAVRILFLLALVAWHPVSAQNVPPTDPPSALAPAIALAHRAERLQAALLQGDEARVAKAVQDVEVLRRDYGLLDVTPLVEAMSVWALARADAGQNEVALAALRRVEHWAPRNPTLLGTRINVLRKKGFSGYLEGLPDVVELSRLRILSPLNRSLFLVQHVAWIRVLASCLLLGWTAALAVRYRRVFRYVWEHPLARRVPNAYVRGLIGALLLTLPILIGLDPALAALFWLWLLVPFLYASELKASIVIVMLQLVHPVLATLEPSAIRVPQPSAEVIQLRPNAQPIVWADVKGLPPGDRAYLTGWVSLQRQDWREAESIFRGLLKTHPYQVGVLNNLGVAAFAQGKPAEAGQWFQEASTKPPALTEVLMNQSILAYSQLDTNLGTQKLDEARKLSPERYVQLRDASQARTEQRTFAAPLPDSPELVAAISAHLKHAPDRNTAPLGAHLWLWIVAPLAGILLLVLRSRQSLREAHPTQCIRCGDAFHTTDSPDPEVCPRCHHLFVLKDGLHGEHRKTKVEEAASFQNQQRWIHRTLIVLFPGLDLVFLGQTRAGLLEYSLLCLAAGMVLGTGRTMRYPGEVLPDPASLWLPIGFGLLVLFYLRSWLKLILRRS